MSTAARGNSRQSNTEATSQSYLLCAEADRHLPRESFFFAESTLFTNDGGGQDVYRWLKSFVEPILPPPIVPPNISTETTANADSSINNTSSNNSSIPNHPSPAVLEALKRKRSGPGQSAALAQALLQQQASAPQLPVYAKKRAKIEQIMVQNNITDISAGIIVPTKSTPSVRNRGVDFSSLCCKVMNNVRVDGVEWKLGQFYLYCHHSYCEHLISLLDVRYPKSTVLDIINKRLSIPSITPQTEQASSATHCFPRETYRANFRRRKCDVCENMFADFILFHDRLLSGFNSTHTLANFQCRYVYQKFS
jgi:hypothetical protein